MKYLLVLLFVLQPSFVLAELPRNDPQQSHRWRLETFAAANDYIADVTTDSTGNFYIVGSTDGSLPGFTSSGGLDGFVAKFNSSGVLQWSQQVGTSSSDALYAVSVSTTGVVLVGGYTGGAFPTFTNAGGNDAFAISYSSAGVQNWLIQFGTTGNDIIYAATRDSTHNPIFGGSTSGSFPTYTNAGGLDMFVTERTAAAGAQTWMRQMGTASNDEIFAVQIDSNNRTYAGGYTEGSFPTYTNAGSADAYLARLSTAGAINWRRQFGTTGDDFIYTLPCRATGLCYPAGLTGGTWTGQTSVGGEDGWVASYTAAGVQNWVRQFGTSQNDSIRGGRMDASNRPNLVGVTAGALSGLTNKGATDIFYARFSTAGVIDATARGQGGTIKADFACASGATNIGTTFPVGGYSSDAYTGYSVLKGIDSYILNFNTTNGVLSVLNQFGSSN